MKNKNYYPFDRNHYFYGKLLTVRDFEVEQKYFNNKRRLLNKLLKGSGVVSGMDIVLIDDQNISIEMGMALDYHGREIVVQEPVIKRLNLVDGFEQVKDSPNVYLCIEYDEVLSEPVHSVVSSPTEGPNGNQFNRITESYRLFLTDEPLPPDVLWEYRLGKEKKVIFHNDKLTIEQIVPKYLNKGQQLDLAVNIIKRGTIEPVELSYEIDSNHVTDEHGNKKITVYYQEKAGKPELRVQQSYPLFAHNVKAVTDQLTIVKEKFSVKLGEEKFSLEQSHDFKVQIIDEPIGDRIISDYYCQDFSEIISGYQQARIYLAKLNLISSNNSYIIESMEKMPYRQYVVNNELLQLMLRTGLNKGLNDEKQSSGDENIRKVVAEYIVNNQSQDESFATGVEEVDLGFENTKNKRFFSGEIAHGLGSGPVALTFAVEDQQEIIDFSQQNVLIFGNNNIFSDTKLPEYQIGALAFPDKGTFRIGLHLLNNVKASGIKVRWWAYKHQGDELKEAGLLELSKIKVLISPDTVSVAPREKVHFTGLVEGTNNKECRWYVKEDNGGKIDHNGVYEAPNAEGVFEVIAESVKYPQKKASAFVVVKA